MDGCGVTPSQLTRHVIWFNGLRFKYSREVTDLANIKSAKKRILVIEAKTLRNKMKRSQLKTAIKAFEKAIETGDKVAAQEKYAVVIKAVDRAVAYGLIHKNCGARKKSQFTKKLNALNA